MYTKTSASSGVEQVFDPSANDTRMNKPDRFADLPRELGRYWLLWILLYGVLCTVSAAIVINMIYWALAS